jgi:glycosidase
MQKKDMKLVMDYVTNHWGIEHWMMKDLPTNDWIHQLKISHKPIIKDQ